MDMRPSQEVGRFPIIMNLSLSSLLLVDGVISVHDRKTCGKMHAQAMYLGQNKER